jgi:tRNA-dihydrouridine synthase
MHIWESLTKPFFVLAPMEDVTDTVFRRIVTKYGRPDLYFTEFTNADAYETKGWETVSRRLAFTEAERPIIAQIWGISPEKHFKIAQKIAELGFDGIDINMGCPVRDVIKNGACSGMINNPSLAKEIIQATKEGARSLPVSVKTRIGFSKIQTEDWIGFLLDQDLPALTVHGRTTKEMSKVPAHWDEIGKAVSLRNAKKVKTCIIGNGDVKSHQEGLEKAAAYGLDGIMIGRGIFQDITIFNDLSTFQTMRIDEKLQILLEHIKLYEETWGRTKKYDVLKKYFKIYVSGFDGASDFRVKLMETKTPSEARTVVGDYLQSL